VAEFNYGEDELYKHKDAAVFIWKMQRVNEMFILWNLKLLLQCSVEAVLFIKLKVTIGLDE